MKKQKKTTSIQVAEMLFVVTLGAALSLSPLLTNHTILAEGWELPKVWFWQVYLCILIPILIVLLFAQKRVTHTRIEKTGALFALILVAMAISSFLSPYLKLVGTYLYRNSVVYRPFVEQNPLFQFLPVSLFGNPFRHMGFITLALLLSFFTLLYLFLKKEHIPILISSFILSSLVQTIIALIQFFQFLEGSSAINVFLQESRIYGSFGQPNFFAGHVLLGFLFLAWYTIQNRKLLPLLLLQCIAILVSGSIIAIALLIFSVVLIFGFIILTTNTFNKVLLSLTFSIVPGSFALGYFAKYISLQFQTRYTIWKNIVYEYLIDPIRDGNYLKFFFGDGPDTLSSAFADRPEFIVPIDRAHNFTLDILANFGVTGFALFVAVFVFYILYVVKHSNMVPKIVGKQFLTYCLLALCIMTARSLLHTNSIITILELGFVILFPLILLKDVPKSGT